MALVSHPGKERLFLTTPVENLFIEEVMGAAPGDFVKVYIYGLMHTSGSDELTLKAMADTLRLTEDDVKRAYEYWSRRRLVEITNDDPFRVSYLSVQQHINEALQMDDLYRLEPLIRRITAFTEPAGLTLSATDQNSFADWIDAYGMSEDCIVSLVEHCALTARTENRRLTMAFINAKARYWNSCGIRTAAEADDWLRREDETYQLCWELKKGWKIDRFPTDTEMRAVQTWLRDWELEADAVREAARHVTTSRPGISYLNSIVEELHNAGVRTYSDAADYFKDRKTRLSEIRSLLRALGSPLQCTAQEPQALYRRIRQAGYPFDAVLLVAKILSRGMHFGLNDLEAALQQRAERNALTVEAIEEEETHLAEWKQGFINILKVWKEERAATDGEGRMYGFWQKEGISLEMMRAAAEESLTAEEKGRLRYMRAVLRDWKERGLTAPPPPSERRPRTAGSSQLPGVHFEAERQYDKSESEEGWDNAFLFREENKT